MVSCFENLSETQRKIVELPEELSDIIDVFGGRLSIENVDYVSNWLQQNTFQLKQWTCRDALQDDQGSVIEYVEGYQFDTFRWKKKIKGGWKKECCEFTGGVHQPKAASAIQRMIAIGFVQNATIYFENE